MEFKIVSDSASNVLSAQGVSFKSVALKINSENGEYIDDSSLDVVKMVSELKTVKGKTSTSCPNVYDWKQAFEGSDNIFCVTITSGLSGSYSAAVQAAEIYMQEKPEANVFVIDTLSAGPEMQLIIEKLNELINKGLNFKEIKQEIIEYKQKTHLIFALESLDNLARNGRVSHAVAKVAGVLGIRIVGIASEQGILELRHKCRGEKKELETIREDMLSLGFNGGKVVISHCLNENAANTLCDLIKEKFPSSQIEINSCRGLCSFYAEQGGLMIGFETDL